MEFFLKECKEQINMSRRVAFFTFLLGSLILLLYYITKFHGTIYIALFFIVAAFFVNSFLTFQLLFSFSINKQQRKSILVSLFLLFLNIPIGLLYINLGFRIYNLISSSIV
jgi:hypothetical protein